MTNIVTKKTDVTVERKGNIFRFSGLNRDLVLSEAEYEFGAQLMLRHNPRWLTKCFVPDGFVAVFSVRVK